MAPPSILDPLMRSAKHRIGTRVLQFGLGLYLLIRIMTEGFWARALWSAGGWASALSPRGGAVGRLLQSAPIYAIVICFTLPAVLLVTGRLTRLASVVAWAGCEIANYMLPAFGDTGDVFARLLFLYSAFLMAPSEEESPGLGVLLHNLLVYLIIWQICLVYVTAALAKLTGSSWTDGTAVYYAVRHFIAPRGAALLEFPFITGAATYAVILLQILFPVAVFSRARPLWLAGTMGFHLFTAIGMGLYTFSLVMIASDLFLLTNDEYFKIRAGWSFRRRAG